MFSKNCWISQRRTLVCLFHDPRQEDSSVIEGPQSIPTSFTPTDTIQSCHPRGFTKARPKRLVKPPIISTHCPPISSRKSTMSFESKIHEIESNGRVMADPCESCRFWVSCVMHSSYPAPKYRRCPGCVRGHKTCEGAGNEVRSNDVKDNWDDMHQNKNNVYIFYLFVNCFVRLKTLVARRMSWTAITHKLLHP